MISDPEIFNQISFSLAKHYECVYYVDIESGHYYIFSDDDTNHNSEFPSEGEDFFGDATKNAYKYIHPDDLELILKTYNVDSMLEIFSRSDNYTVVYRSVVNGQIVHMRQVEIMCKDNKHIVCCLENIEEEFQKKEEQKKILQSAELMARRDEMTGVKNSNAFKEYTDSIDKKILSGPEEIHFGVVMCDINYLKLINDTRGHNYGNEAIQAASRQICAVYRHSPVFRVGGDEFVVVLQGNDYEQRDRLLYKFREETEANRKSRSGPIVASGMALYEKDDKDFSDVLGRADRLMYENKNEIKSLQTIEGLKNINKMERSVPDERRHRLDALFGALVTVSGEGYVYLNDLYYDYSRCSLSLTDDFGLESEYIYHAEKIWQDFIHPDDLEVFNKSVADVFNGNAEGVPVKYRARKKDGTYVILSTKGFVLSDEGGNPEYFGGVITPDKSNRSRY